MMNASPKSPKKRNEIVQTLSQKLYLRIALHTKNSGRPENNLSEDKVERLCQFMNRPNITCKNAGEKDQQYTGKKDVQSKFVPICYHIWTIKNLLEIINGCSGIVHGE